MNTKTVGVAVIALIIGGGIGYVIPHSAAAANRSGLTANGGGQFGRGGFARIGAGANGSMLAGTVVSVSGQDVTLNTPDGSSHVVLLTPDTTVSKSVVGSVSDLTNGANVLVSGTMNSDGSVSANFIQLRPAGAQGRFGTRATSTPNAAP